MLFRSPADAGQVESIESEQSSLAEAYLCQAGCLPIPAKQTHEIVPKRPDPTTTRRPPRLAKSEIVFGGLEGTETGPAFRRGDVTVRPMRKPPKWIGRWRGDQFLLLRNVPSFAVAWKNGIGSSDFRAEVNALESDHIVRGANSAWVGSK